jgi:hypothetical protein
MTPTQIELHNAHLARKQRIADAAARLNPKTDCEFSIALNAAEDPAKSDVSSDQIRRVDLLERRLDELYEIVSRQGELLAQAAKGIVDTRPTFTEIMDVVCEFYGVSHVDLKSARRTAVFARPRQISCYLGRQLTGMSLPQIGRRLGGRDHTTILHNANKIASEGNVDEVLRDDIDVLELKISEKVLNRQMPRGVTRIHKLPVMS